jgi:hypothetical protein
MNAKLIQIVPLLGCLIMMQSAALIAQESDPKFTLSAGVEFTSGSYGGDTDIDDIYIPFTATLGYGRVMYRLTVPYLSVSAPEGTIFDPGGEPLPGSGELVTESGLGDIVGSVTVYDVLYSQRLGLAMDLSGRVKFGTADADKGIGTQLTLVGSVGYKLRGDPTGVDLDNVLMASIGATYRLAPKLNTGLFFDYRESAITGNDAIQELSAFVSRPVSEDWQLQLYALTGFSDSSPDWGGGVRFKRTLRH